MVEGVRIHSGDILLSRGGAPSSAFIARANDYPGSFSHVAMVYIDADKRPIVIESLIEKGVVTSSIEEFLKAKKYRILVLRMRPDHPMLKLNPMLPHEASMAMLSRVQKNKISYNFEMNWTDDERFFCSEVVYHAYKPYGLELWQYHPRITKKGVRQWLSDLGVRYFEFLVPSDIQYDPNLVTVAEWLNHDTLYDDGIDNVILDVLLEDAEHGVRLRYSWHKLLVVHAMKLITLFQNDPTIPPGMSASTVLRIHSLIENIHPHLKKK